MENTEMDEIVEVRRKQLRHRLSQASMMGAGVGAIVGLCIAWLACHPTQWGIGAIAIIGIGTSVFATALLTVVTIAIKLGAKPSRGGGSPIQALTKFYSNVLVSRGTIYSKVQAEAMFFLHPSVVTSIRGWKGFETYWTGVNDQIYRQLASICRNSPTGTSVGAISVKPVANSTDSNRFLVTISFRTKYDKQNLMGTYDTYTEGPWSYSAENEVVMEDGRWYLASVEWTGRLSGD
jgi:hypothetical protein